MIDEYDIEVKYEKVKAHDGIYGNIQADRLANKGAERDQEYYRIG